MIKTTRDVCSPRSHKAVLQGFSNPLRLISGQKCIVEGKGHAKGNKTSRKGSWLSAESCWRLMKQLQMLVRMRPGDFKKYTFFLKKIEFFVDAKPPAEWGGKDEGLSRVAPNKEFCFCLSFQFLFVGHIRYQGWLPDIF